MLRPGLPVILTSLELSGWVSCQTITANLARAYNLSFQNDRHFYSISRSQDPFELERLAQELLRLNPSRIILLDDHMPHPKDLIEALVKEFGASLPPLYIHVYGDFSFGTTHWQAIEPLLVGKRILFVCASQRHRNLVSSFIKLGERHTALCPFPVNADRFRFRTSIRQSYRKKAGISSRDRLLVYTGRLTLQKNLLRLIEEVTMAMENQSQKIFLHMAGHFDNRAGPFDGIAPFGYFFQAYMDAIRGLSPRIQKRIRLLGHLDEAQLSQLYCAADAFISLSTFHDEDFGLSPAEALLSGCPVLLTDWAGFSGFNLHKNAGKFIPLQINKKGLQLSSEKIQTAFNELLTETEDLNEKVSRSEFFRNVFSIESIAKRITELHRQPTFALKGFTPQMAVHAGRLNPNQPWASPSLFADGMGRASFYHQIYQNYLE